MSSTSSCSTPSVTTSALINSVSQLVQAGVINPSPSQCTTPNNSIHLSSTHQGSSNTQVFFSNQEEKIYKKEKQILFEFETKSKDIKSQLNEGIKCLEQRLDTQISILYELQDYFKKRAEVEMQYSRDLDKLNKQILARHKSEKTKRETWHLHSTYKLWEALLNDTRQHSKYHQTASDICSKYVGDRFDEIIEDIRRMFLKCKGIGQSTHEEIFKVIGELNGAMKTYHEYQSEAKQAEAKLKYVQAQKPKFEKQKSKKKLKQYEKQVEKRLHKYTETKVKSFKARNEYILSIDSANACINKFCTDDIGDIVDCTDFGFHASVAKCIYMYLSAQENIKRSRQQTVDQISRCIGDLDSNADKQKYLEYFNTTFNIKNKFQFEPHKGDEVSQVNAQSLIRLEMEKRFEQLDHRLNTLKTENDEIFKTIEATEKSLLNYFDLKNCDMSDLFRDLNLPNHSNGPKEKRLEIEDYYVQKVKQYTTSSNLIARLEARHKMMQKALNGCVNSSEKQTLDKFNQLVNLEKKKKIGKSPIIGQPRLFGGKLIEYINVTKQEIPLIMTSCIRAINRLGLHNQGIFRIPGSQLEINQFKESFEKGEDPLITVNPREMNSVAGVLKLYLRELKEPLFPRELYDKFISSLRVSSVTASTTSQTNDNSLNCSDSLITTTNGSPIESIEAIKIENIRKTMCQVPKPIYIILRYFFAFLNHLSEFKDENMMDAYNIAICLAPTLIPVPEDKKDQVNHQTDTIELIKLIIQHNDDIFSMECDGTVYEKFDSEIDNDEIDDNLEESENDDEEESEKQFLKNLSDDATSLIDTPSPSIRITSVPVVESISYSRLSQPFFYNKEKRRFSSSSANSNINFFPTSNTNAQSIQNRSSSSSSSMSNFHLSSTSNSLATTPTTTTTTHSNNQNLKHISEEENKIRSNPTNNSSNNIDVDYLIRKVDELVETDV
ncbi:unnamed protein product [Brachionus calyciflorus]|uniref:Uncharacterized protein n=1 Tax=Brachionus calyciflorus TaxID=104777 RepID=A0A813Z507_9BILA|nr:unnamed protein product [Brachionus calyciflorus]